MSFFDAERLKEMEARLRDNKEFKDFQKNAHDLEHAIMDVIAACPAQDIRVVVAALGPLIANAVAHLSPVVGEKNQGDFVVATFKQLAALSLEHLQKCEHMKEVPTKEDPYAPPVVH